MFEVAYDGKEVIVCEQGRKFPLLEIRLSNRIQKDNTVMEELVVGASACLAGDFEMAEAQARAYVQAFDLARRVLTPNVERNRPERSEGPR